MEMRLIRATTTMKIDQEILEDAERRNKEKEQKLFAYYCTKLKRELELGVITLSTLDGFFLSDEKAARFKSRLTEAIFGKEQSSHLGFYNPYEGEPDEEDDELDEETFRIFFADEEEDEDDIPVMFSSLTNNSTILNSNERKAVL